MHFLHPKLDNRDLSAIPSQLTPANPKLPDIFSRLLRMCFRIWGDIPQDVCWEQAGW